MNQVLRAIFRVTSVFVSITVFAVAGFMLGFVLFPENGRRSLEETLYYVVVLTGVGALFGLLFGLLIYRLTSSRD